MSDAGSSRSTERRARPIAEEATGRLPDDPFGGQPEVGIDAQAFAVEIVQHVQQPERPAIAETVDHEIHRPGHVRQAVREPRGAFRLTAF